MKKMMSTVCTAAFMLSVLTGCGGKSNGDLQFTTGEDQGTYYSFGSVIAGQVTNSTETKVTAITSVGSQANIQALSDGDAQLAFVQSDIMTYAYNGTRLFDKPITDFSTVAALYMEQVQIVTLDPSIQSVADLAGKTVSVGDMGSGIDFNAVDILGVYNLNISTDVTPVYESFAASMESLQENKIDAAFIVAGTPTNAITSLAATKSVYIVSLDDEHIQQLHDISPYYAKAVIPAATYNMLQDATTVAVGAAVIANDNVSDNDIYNFISGIFEHTSQITNSHAKGAELNLDFASSITSVPYHPGAARYFSEKGITVPVK